MKIDFRIVLSMLFGAALVWVFQAPSQPASMLVTPAVASSLPSTVQVENGDLDHCEMVFSDDRDFFETAVNRRISNTKLIQSNVIWSETTKQLGFYAMICY